MLVLFVVFDDAAPAPSVRADAFAPENALHVHAATLAAFVKLVVSPALKGAVNVVIDCSVPALSALR